MDELVSEFVAESLEGLDQLDLDFVQLENNPQDKETLASVFRTLHTIKGACGFLEFSTLEKVAHSGENLLVKLRDGRLSLNAPMTTTLLRTVDAIREQLDQIASTGQDGGDYAQLIAELDAFADGADSGGDSGSDSGSDSVNVTGSDPDSTPDASTETALDEASGPAPRVEQSVVRDYVAESNECLECIEEYLLKLEDDPANLALVAEIFRAMHTIKGKAEFFGFKKIEYLAHAGEGLLEVLRSGKQPLSEELMGTLLELQSALADLVAFLSANGTDQSDTDLSPLHAHIAGLSGVQTNESGKRIGGLEMSDELFKEIASEIKAAGKSGSADNAGAAPASSTDDDKAPAAEPAANTPAVQAGKSASPAASSSAVDASIRVDVPLLDSLMNLVGELVLARNQIVEYISHLENTQIVSATQRLNLITTELQEGVMQTRMQPIHSVWTKFPRIVRDLSHSLGKKVRVEMEGKDTELDKSLIEAIKDPMTHLVRNAVDHGVEDPERRRAAGKPEEGVLRLRSFHEGGQVHIEIGDDGAGINPQKLLKKAIENGVVTAETAQQMTDQEIGKLIFLPGLSTAEAVTNISGRGVGMDVVKTNIERISGTIDLESVPGQGTTFRIKVPLTLAIIPALIVTSGDERFAIPQVNLIELIRIDQENRDIALETIQGCPVYRLRGQLLPLVHLNEELELPDRGTGTLNIVVLHAEHCRFGLVVDQIIDTQEIVVKPLADVLKSIPVYAGATIMGDGQVALILDTLGIAQRANVMTRQQELQLLDDDDKDAGSSGEIVSLLLVTSRAGDRLAVPLDAVARLEQFNVEDIEKTGSLAAVQYRGQIMPLIPIENVLEYAMGNADVYASPLERLEGDDIARVVVFGSDGEQVGLLVNEIIDIVNEATTVSGQSGWSGTQGTIAVQGRITELLDTTQFIERTRSVERFSRQAA